MGGNKREKDKKEVDMFLLDLLEHIEMERSLAKEYPNSIHYKVEL